MLTTSRSGLLSARFSSALVSSTFDSDVPIRSRRLQILSYVLAQLSSAATLLDDHVRGTANIAHRLCVAWQSIVVAATAREARYTTRSSTLKRRSSRRGSTAFTSLSTSTEAHENDRDCDGVNLRISRRRHSGKRSLTTSLDSCCYLEDEAARHVEFTRRTVVAALFEQFLQVTVEKSMDDLLLFGWIGSEFTPKTKNSLRLHSRHYQHRQCHHHNRRHQRSGRRTKKVDDSQNTCEFDDKEEEEEVGHGGQEMRASPGCKRTRCDIVSPSWPMIQSHLYSGSDDEHEEIPLGLQTFTLAAAAFNPTVCALELMSRCVLYARNVRNVDHEIALDVDVTDSMEGFFNVVVASRTVGTCEHSGACFGNRKFFFVRCQESEWRRKHEVASPGGLAFISPSKAGRQRGSVASDEHWVMNCMSGSLIRAQTEDRILPQLHWSNRAPRFQGTTDRISCLPSVRSTRCFINNSSWKDSTPISLPSIMSGSRGDGVMGSEMKSHERRRGRTVPKRHQKTKDRSTECHHDDSYDEEQEESMNSWLVMHSNRCSATGTFFSTSTSCQGRLIADVMKSSGTSLPTSMTAFDGHDLVTSLDQAILVPPNAGHDTKYREQVSTEHHSEATGPASAGHFAFAEELIARLNFWCARGEPQKRYYYDPVVADGDQTTKGDSTMDWKTDVESGFATLNDTWNEVKTEMPLKLLFTQVGMIQFSPPEGSIYRNCKGQQLLSLALADSTELVICTTRESRPHYGWHDHGRREGEKNDGYDASDDCTLSDDDGDPFSWGRYDDVAMKATVRWTQGEVATDDEEDVSDVCNDDTLEEEDEDVPTSKTSHVLGRRALSTMEQRRRKNERLKIEFRLSRSQRIDALLVDKHRAKPVAALTLCQAPRDSYHLECDTQLLQQTIFLVVSFSHCVSRLLRHLREEKVIMVDMDRTLVDNAILVDNDNFFSSKGRTAVPWRRTRGIREDNELHYEVQKEVHYFVTEAPHQPMRMETIYVRHGVRRLLRRFAVEWGIPLVLVTKSSRRRTEAILSQVLDPDEELFQAGRGRIITAEEILRSMPDDAISLSSHSVVFSDEGGDGEWRRYQEKLANSLKSTKVVLQEFESASVQRRGLRCLLPKARSVAVLDDSPQIWVEADWPCTVSIAPYTLGRIDPRGYFTKNGFIASLLLSTLYRGKCVVCPIPQCNVHKGEPSTSAVNGVGYKNSELRVDSDLRLRNNMKKNNTKNKNFQGVACIEETRSSLSCSVLSGRVGSDLAKDMVAYAEEPVVEEVVSLPDESSWNTAEVEDVTPL